MSRCLPFPPPSYSWKGVSGEALSELLKTRREEAIAEKERKKEKKRRERKQAHQEKRSHHSRHRHDRSKKDEQRMENQSKRKYETLLQEGSGLTEEQGQPVFACSYDSSDNNHSIKNKKHSSSVKDSYVHESSVCNFRLQKHKTPSPITPASVSQEFASQSSRKPCYCSSRRTKLNTNGKSEMAPTESSCSECYMEMISSKYRQLTEDWNRSPVQHVLEGYDDQDWLFESQLSRNETKTSNTIGLQGSDHGDSTLYPHAQYLPEVDIYALPYTVPY